MDQFFPFINYEEELNIFSTSHGPETYEKIFIQGKIFYKCLSSGCSKVFPFKSDVGRHHVTHTKARPFVCSHPSCNRAFKRPDALKNHIDTHNEETPLECPVEGCKAQFQKKSTFQYHLFKHQKLSHFLCSFEGCQQTFSSYNDLKQHRMKDCQARRDSLFIKKENSQASEVSTTKLSPAYEFEAIFKKEEEFSPKPTKSLCIESKQRRALPRKKSKDFSEIISKMPFEVLLDQTQTNSEFVKFLQKMGKTLMKENEKLKKKLADQMVNVQSRYGVEDFSLGPVFEF